MKPYCIIISNQIIQRLSPYMPLLHKFLAKTSLLTVTICTLLFVLPVLSQDDPFQVPQYNFIDYESNKIIDNTGTFANELTKNILSLITGNGKTIIAHIGDSHIQADFFSSKVRNRLQMLHPGISGPRGLLFPFNLAASNNPHNYNFQSPNNWTPWFSTKIKEPSEIGLFGVKISTNDSLIELNIKINDTISELFNIVELWYSADIDGIIAFKSEKIQLQYSLEKGKNRRFLCNFPADLKEIKLRIIYPTVQNFELFGVKLGNDLSGIEYHAIGLNGASTTSFNRCLYFENQLKCLNPNLIILSLGTNDAYAGDIISLQFKNEYNTLINTIQKACPSTPILLTTPNNHARHRYDMTEKITIINDVIKEISKEKGLAIWDFHTLMGGKNSIYQWQKDSLAAKDMIHLSPKGYRLKADLFYIALLKLFDKNVSNTEIQTPEP